MVVKEHTELLEITEEEKSLLILALDMFASKYMTDQMNMLKNGTYDSLAYGQAQRFIETTGKLVKKINSRNEVLC